MSYQTSVSLEAPLSLSSATVWDYVELLKPRLMSLSIFTAMIGAFLAPGTLHPFLFFVATLCIAVGAGAAGAINMWYDRDIDAMMTRTQKRPIPAGRVPPSEALSYGVFLASASVVTLGLAVNVLSAALLAGTIAFYTIIYSMLLKRRTVHNTVIGGVAGALPPVIGWTAVSGALSFEAFFLFAIIFLWQPQHFWALALNRLDDFTRAKLPMLPVVSGSQKTRNQMFLYTLLLMPVSGAPYFVGMFGIFYVSAAVVLGGIFLRLAWRLRREEGLAWAFFRTSIFYLFLLFSSMVVDRLLGSIL